MTDRMAIIRIRGRHNLKPDTKRTLELLRLERPNHCVVMDPTPQTLGMLKIIKDYVTFGKISEVTLSALLAKRGDGAKEPRGVVFRLSPPRKGLRNIKLSWPAGALGAREDMDTFIKKMI
jgi:ribosomal protein L30/L7E